MAETPENPLTQPGTVPVLDLDTYLSDETAAWDDQVELLCAPHTAVGFRTLLPISAAPGLEIHAPAVNSGLTSLRPGIEKHCLKMDHAS